MFGRILIVLYLLIIWRKEEFLLAHDEVINVESILQISMQSLPSEEIDSAAGSRQKRQISAVVTSTMETLTTMEKDKLERNLTFGNLTLYNGTLDYFSEKGEEDDDDLIFMLLLSEGKLREVNDTVEITSSHRNTTSTAMQDHIVPKTKLQIPSAATAAVRQPEKRQRKTTDESVIWPLAWLKSQSNERIPLDLFTTVTTTKSVATSISSTMAIESTTTRMARKLCCPSGGIWGNWSMVGHCDDHCGACGKQYYQRECLSLAWGCPCFGESMAKRECALMPCPFPRLSCCNGRKVLNATGHQALCGQPSDPPANLPLPDCLCCPVGGIWSAWTPEGECSDMCGSCGTRHYVRQCLSSSWGCPCSGPVSMDLVCNQNPCTFPRLSCCANMKLKASKSRTVICGHEVGLPEKPTPSALCP